MTGRLFLRACVLVQLINLYTRYSDSIPWCSKIYAHVWFSLLPSFRHFVLLTLMCFPFLAGIPSPQDQIESGKECGEGVCMCSTWSTDY